MILELILGLEGLHFGYWAIRGYNSRMSIFNLARQTADNLGKPMINVGCADFLWLKPFRDMTERSDVNFDIKPCDVPNFVQGDVYDMNTFKDKQFGAAYVAHLFEHLEYPERALKELERVADHVFILVPNQGEILAWIYPEHRWVYTGENIEQRTVLDPKLPLLGFLGLNAILLALFIKK